MAMAPKQGNDKDIAAVVEFSAVDLSTYAKFGKIVEHLHKLPGDYFRVGAAASGTELLSADARCCPNLAKSLVSFARALVAKGGCPSTSQDPEHKGCFSEVSVRLGVEYSAVHFQPFAALMLAGPSKAAGEAEFAHARSFLVYEAAGAEQKIFKAAPDQLRHITGGSAWSLVPPWLGATGELSEVDTFILTVSTPPWPKRFADSGEDAARLRRALASLGFELPRLDPASLVSLKGRAKDVARNAVKQDLLVQMAGVGVKAFEAKHRPHYQLIQNNKATKRKEAQLSKEFCSKCSCVGCVEKKQKMRRTARSQ